MWLEVGWNIHHFGTNQPCRHTMDKNDITYSIRATDANTHDIQVTRHTLSHTHTHTHTHIHTQSHRSSSWFGIRHQPSGNNHIHKGTTQGIYCEARWEHHVKEKEKRCMSLACGLVPPTHPQPASGPATCEVALNIPFRQISFLFSRIIHFHHHTNNQHK